MCEYCQPNLTQICTSCGEGKPSTHDFFNWRNDYKTPKWNSICKKCRSDKLKLKQKQKVSTNKEKIKYANLPEEEKEKIRIRDRQRYANLSEEEKEKIRIRDRQRYSNLSEEEKEKIRIRDRQRYSSEKQKQYYELNKHKKRKYDNSPERIKIRRENFLNRKFKINKNAVNLLSEKQQQKCIISGQSIDDIDHCHNTGIVRGLLNHNINAGLGKFKDDTVLIQNAINYLQNRELQNIIQRIIKENEHLYNLNDPSWKYQDYEYRRNQNMRSKYGISLHVYNKILEHQNGKCAISGELCNDLEIDHCHETGIVRGLLSSECNKGLGLFQDNIEWLKNAIDYLNHNKSTTNKIKEWLNGNNISYKEYDNYIELRHNLRIYAIDNGLLYKMKNKYTPNGIDPKYFKNISIENEKQNIRTIWIKPWEWFGYKKEILQSHILHSLGFIKKENTYNARDCIIKEVSNKEIKQFQIENCFYGYRSASISLALFHKNNTEIPLMIYTFGHPYFDSNNYDIEIIRAGTLKNHIVRGGASKLFKHFLRNYEEINGKKWNTCIYYVDYDHNNGNSLEKVGFEFMGYSTPGFMNVNVATGEASHRKPMQHNLIMEKIKNGEMYSVANAGVKKYKYTRE